MSASPLPGMCIGVAEPSTLTACCSAGSVEEFVAEIFMHRAAKGVGRMAAADVREKLLQGEAAVRNMAVPVNWRVLGVQDVLQKLGAAMMQDRLASARPGGKRARQRGMHGCSRH